MKVVITARNFSIQDKAALNMLLDAGLTVSDYSDRNYGTGTSEEEMICLLRDAEIAITGLEPFGQAVISACPKLRLLSKRSIGYDSVDLEACKQAGITVTRTTGMVEAAVAEHAMAFLLYFARNLAAENEQMHRGIWNRVMSCGAKNRTLGLVGFGSIGKEIARRAYPFGMELLYYCRHPNEAWEEEYHARYAPLDVLLSRSDYVCVNVNLSESTRGMFGAEQFRKMKPGAVFINIARSGVMDTMALKDALDSGRLRGAGIDVFDHEPCTDSPLMACPNAILTPHTAPFTSENFAAMNCCAAQNVLDFLSGRIRPENRLV